MDEDDDPGYDEDTGPESSPARRRLLVIGLPLAALAIVVALAWWFGSSVLSVADSVEGGAPTPSAPSASSAPAEDDGPAPADGPPATIVSGTVLDPGGDGEPENVDEIPLSFDGDPATAWSTLTYRGSPAFGNLKDGVGVVYDLGSEQALAGVSLTTTTPGATVEVRVGEDPDAGLDGFDVVAEGDLDETTDLAFDDAVTTRYVLVWVTGLVPADDGFSADIAEVEPQPAG